MSERFYLTTAIAYPNGRPHMGHAYEVITTDVIARYRRLKGDRVRFLTGTDEHGLKIAQAARAEDVTPRAYVDRMVAPFQAMDEVLNISFDRFIRTTDADHKALCAELWQRMADKGDLYLDRYEGWYSVRDEAYYDESELVDAEDSAGQKIRLSPQGTPVEWTVEESWFFKLSAYTDKLLALYDANPGFIQPPGRRNEMRSFVAQGLRDLSMSRTSFDWGVPVPGSPGHVMYVWVDALANYLTGAGGLNGEWWPADLHVVGKDVMRFHTIYWPAFLMSADLALPRTVFGHGHVLIRGEKMSKSLGNVVDPVDMATRFGVDRLRWFLCRDVAFGDDGSYSDEAIIERCNADLANGLGNLAQRALSIVAKDGGAMPAGIATGGRGGRAQGSLHRRYQRLFRRDGIARPASRARSGDGHGQRRQPLFRRQRTLGAEERPRAPRWRAGSGARCDTAAGAARPALHSGLGRQIARPAWRGGQRA